MTGDEDEARMCVLACSFHYCVYSHNLARAFTYLETNVPVCLQFGYTTYSTIRHDHATIDSSANALWRRVLGVGSCTALKFLKDEFAQGRNFSAILKGLPKTGQASGQIMWQSLCAMRYSAVFVQTAKLTRWCVHFRS